MGTKHWNSNNTITLGAQTKIGIGVYEVLCKQIQMFKKFHSAGHLVTFTVSIANCNST